MKIRPFALVLLTSCIATTAIAQPISDIVTKSTNQFYAGFDLEAGGSAKADVLGTTIEDNSDIGFSLIGGYEFATHEVVKPSLELEYRKFGGTDYHTLSVDAQAFMVNAKAKLFVLYDFGNIYLAPMFGVGVVDLDVKESLTGLNSSDTETAIQAGLEIGTRINEKMDLNFGYKAAFTEVENIDVTLDGFYLGFRYFFK